MRILGGSYFEEKAEVKPDPQAYTKPSFDYGSIGSSWSFSIFNGEKTLGGIGPVTEYSVDGKALRTRGWEGYLTNETVQTIINKCVTWVIGCGLRLQSEILLDVLKSEGIIIDEDAAQEISDLIEARFSLFKEQKWSTYCKEKNLSQLEAVTYKNADVGGDVLVVIYFDGEFPNVHLIDGAHVKSPQGGDDWNPTTLANGNRIVNGVEMNTNGEHVAYHVLQADSSFKRVEARSKSSGLRMAYLVGGFEYRLDYARAYPAITGVLEVLATMDRYKLATLTTAEETAKMVLQMTYGPSSTGENPIVKRLAAARDAGGNDGTVPLDSQRKEIANEVAVSTNKQVFQMPIDSKLEPVEKNKGELYFKDFYSMFFDIVCASLNVPPNVAMSKYDSNFSAARAAIKDWEHTLTVKRYNFALAFLQPIYEFWLYVEVRRNKVVLPGYLNAFADNNRMAVAAYNNARWVGDSVPHIDPVKEVEAIRGMLGETGASLPLIDHEGAVEKLGGGNAKAITKRYAKDKDEAEALGIKAEVPPPPGGKKSEDKPEDE